MKNAVLMSQAIFFVNNLGTFNNSIKHVLNYVFCPQNNFDFSKLNVES